MDDDRFRMWIEELKDVTDCFEVGTALGLRPVGKRFFCPTCQPTGGKTPDLSASRNGFFCFKCGVKGDVFAFVQLVRRMEFNDAVDWLASHTGRSRPDGRRGSGTYRDKKWDGMERNGTKKRDPVRVQPHDPDPIAAFLAGCRPADGQALKYLTDRGIDAAVVQAIGVRFCGKEYEDLMSDLVKRFGAERLDAVGLMVKGKKGPYATFGPLAWKRVGFLVIPYVLDGCPVYLKARPPIDKATAEAKQIPRFLNTGKAVPCPFNADVLKASSRVLICEGETDTMTALSHGYDAVGVPGWSHFKPDWTADFKGKDVFLVMDADPAGEQGAVDVAKKFERAGLPVPRQVRLPAGMDLNEYFRSDEKGMEGRNEGTP